MPILKEELDALSKYGVLKTEMPEVITANLNPAFPLRDYQKEALFRFIFYITDYQKRVKPTQLLSHMATGSGKTLIFERSNAGLYRKLTLISAPGCLWQDYEWVAHLGLPIFDFGLVSAGDHAGGTRQSEIQNQKSRIRVAWASLDERDNAPVRFWAYVIAALQNSSGRWGRSCPGDAPIPPIVPH